MGQAPTIRCSRRKLPKCLSQKLWLYLEQPHVCVAAGHQPPLCYPGSPGSGVQSATAMKSDFKSTDPGDVHLRNTHLLLNVQYLGCPPPEGEARRQRPASGVVALVKIPISDSPLHSLSSLPHLDYGHGLLGWCSSTTSIGLFTKTFSIPLLPSCKIFLASS